MVYIASPFFNDEQRHEVDVIEETCAKCTYDYFSPRRSPSSPYYSTLKPENENFELVKNLIFNDDIIGLDKSDVLICNPSNLDSGTLFELGYAIAKNKRIIPAFPKHVPIVTELVNKLKEAEDTINKASIIKAKGDTEILTKTFAANKTKIIIAETVGSSEPYKGFSKVIAGYLYAKDYPLIYVDIPRKSNLMLTCSCMVYEVHSMNYLDSLLAKTKLNETYEDFLQFLNENADRVFGRQDD